MQSLSHMYVARCQVCCSNAPSPVTPEWQAGWTDDRGSMEACRTGLGRSQESLEGADFRMWIQNEIRNRNSVLAIHSHVSIKFSVSHHLGVGASVEAANQLASTQTCRALFSCLSRTSRRQPRLLCPIFPATSWDAGRTPAGQWDCDIGLRRSSVFGQIDFGNKSLNLTQEPVGLRLKRMFVQFVAGQRAMDIASKENASCLCLWRAKGVSSMQWKVSLGKIFGVMFCFLDKFVSQPHGLQWHLNYFFVQPYS